MSLNGALHVGRTAITASQAAIQVAGNNMANAATPGFHRQSVHLAPIRGEALVGGQFVGQGVQLLAIRREIDTALQSRYRDAISDESASTIDQRLLTALETLQNELTDNDLSSLLGDFFNSFSELANNPGDNATRSLVIQQGVSVSGRVADLRRGYDDVLQQIDDQLGSTVEVANELLNQVGLLNVQIATAESGEGEANALRDRRDLLIDELSEYMDLSVIERPTGAVDILVNSIPVLLAGGSRGLELRSESVDGERRLTVRVAEDGSILEINSGTIGGLLRQRDSESVGPMSDALDLFANQLIFQVNRLHSQGQGGHGFTDVTGTSLLNDVTANLNADAADLPFTVENGSFFVHMTHQATGERTTYEISVDGDAMSLNDLADEINLVVGVPNLTAGVNAERAFTLAADAGYEMSFSDDTSGALAALGINTFFSGRGASTMDVNQRLIDDPSLLAVGAGHVPGSNDTALAIADMQDADYAELGGTSLRGYWQNAVNGLAVKTSTANRDAESASLVRESLSAQLQAATGVSLDEESINLLTYQRQFQAAARYISAIDEALQILLNLV